MTRDDYTTYKWLDADEMRPKRDTNDAQAATNKILGKLLEMLVSDNG